jgi:hypothetical protein
MITLDRVALIVRPKRRFVEWANRVEPEGPTLTLERARAEATVYLVAVEDDLEDVRAMIDEYAVEVFEEQLLGWHEDESAWPANRTPHVFRDWFDVEVADIVNDLDEHVPIDPAWAPSVEEAWNHCGWCGAELEKGESRRTVSFIAHDPETLADARGQVIPWPVGDGSHAVLAIVLDVDPEAGEGDPDFMFTVCGPACESALTAALAGTPCTPVPAG